MKRSVLALIAAALAVATGALSAAGTDIRYEWKATGERLLDPALKTPVDKTPAYLFDASVCSPSNLVEKLRKGCRLRSIPFVLAKEISDGVIPAGDMFAYGGEQVGVKWGAYMAVQSGSDVYISPEVPVMGLAMGLAATITFENLGESFGRSVETPEYSEPGWYSFEAAAPTLCPGDGIDELEVSADDAATAVNAVAVVSPDVGIVSDADYLKYFKLTATPLSEGRYLVCAELDETAIDMDKTVASFAAQLSDLAQKGGATVTVEIVCKPGLSYRVLSASAVAGPYAKGEPTPISTGDKTEVKVAVPEGGKAFFKIGIGATEKEGD